MLPTHRALTLPEERPAIASRVASRLRQPAVGLAALLLVFMAGPRAEPVQESLLDWLVEGEVRSAARVGQTLYVGGHFLRVAPSADALPPVYAVSTSTGRVTATFPAVTGQVSHIIDDGAAGYFLAGDFATIAPVRRHLVHVAGDGTLDPAFNAQLTSEVRGVARVGARLYLIGRFPSPSGPVEMIAVSATTGAAVPWQAPPLAPLVPEAISAAADRIFVAGTSTDFRLQTGVVAAFDASTGAELWRAAVSGGGVGNRGQAWAVAHDAGDVFVAHSPTSANAGLSKLAASTGARDLGWDPGVSPTAFTLSANTIYVTGDRLPLASTPPTTFTGLMAIDRATAANRGHLRLRVPATQLAAAASNRVFVATPFEAGGPLGRLSLAQFDTTGPFATTTDWTSDVGPDRVFAMAAIHPDTLVVSSSVAAPSLVERTHLAAFDLDSGALLPWSPPLPSVYGVSFIAASPSRVVFTEGIRTYASDPATGVLIADQFGPDEMGVYADPEWVYTVRVFTCCTPPQPPHVLRRYSLATGALDDVWQPDLAIPVAPSRAAPPLAMTSDAARVYVAHPQSGTVALDRRSGRILWANPSARLMQVALSGATLFGTDGSNLWSYDVRGGRAIATTPIATGVAALAVADGRLVTSETVGTLGGRQLAARSFDGSLTDWGPGVGTSYPPTTPERFVVLDDVLVAGGAFAARAPRALRGLAAFSLTGASSPTALRTRSRGDATELFWQGTAAPLTGYVLEAGLTPGRTDFSVPVGVDTSFAAVVPTGTYFARVRARLSSGANEVSNEVLLTGGCTAPPPPPTGFSASASFHGGINAVIRLSWTAPDAFVTTYTLVAGLPTSQTDLATIPIAGSETEWSFSTGAVPPRSYRLRLRASNACGSSTFTPNIQVNAPIQFSFLPMAPQNLVARVVAPRQVHVSWTNPSTSLGTAGYVLEVGSDAGLADLAVLSTAGPVETFTASEVPPGVYVLRVRAINGNGTGPPSPDVWLRVP